MGCSCSKEKILIDSKKFNIISRIAEGGFGSIDLVEETSNGNYYAMKKIKCESRNEIEKFSQENKFYKLLNNHSNIVKLMYDDILDDKKSGGFFILSIFPYYQNGNLQEELESNQKISKYIKNDRVIRLFKGICSGLSYIHEVNLAHRDLKPQNVLLSDDRQVPILTDFGSMTERQIEITSSKKAQEVQEWAAENCSMFYKAPELFEPKVDAAINEKADIWSLGCILFALLFNNGPFDYVAEKGDSIALAVANTKYFIPNRITRIDCLTNMLKKTILYDPKERDSLNKLLNDLNSSSILAGDNENQQIV